MTRFSIASYSFHRALESGKQDMFRYITDSRDLGCSQLDPWNGHLVPLLKEDESLRASGSLAESFSPAGLDYAARVKAAADEAGLPFACLAVDDAHIYEPTPEARAVNRASAARWLEVAVIFGAEYLRVDSGGTPELPDDMFRIIVAGYNDLIARARNCGLNILMENHWGASRVAENVVRMLDAIDGLSLLFDTNNFVAGTREHGWELCAPYARSVHIKTFQFDETGHDPTVDIPKVVGLLRDAGYDGCWGIESVPHDGDEYGAIRKTMSLIQHSLA